MPGLSIILSTAVLLAPAATLGINSPNQDEKVLEVKKAFSQNSPLLIAQKYGGTDPHGPDPHGDDPHDETYDSKMPANQKRNFNRAPKDVYGDKLPNNQQPY